jgi:hypothetical protein
MMEIAMRDLMNHTHPVVALAPKAAVTDNTPFVGVWVDRRGYEALTFLLITGILTDADATCAVTIEHADASDQSDAAAVVEADDLVGTLALAGFTFADDAETRKVGYVGEKRYVRITVTPSNNTGNIFLAIIASLGHPLLQPTANPPV